MPQMNLNPGLMPICKTAFTGSLLFLVLVCPVLSAQGPASVNYVDIPYYNAADDFASTLVINNNWVDSIPVTVNLYSASGEPYPQSKTFEIPTDSPLRVNVADLLGKDENKDENAFRTGNIRLSYPGPAYQITSQLTVTSESQHVSISVEMGMGGAGMSSKLVGILWSPGKEAEAFVAVTNADSKLVTVSLTAGGVRKSLRLSPRETRILGKGELIPNEGDDRAPTLISLQYSGKPGTVMAVDLPPSCVPIIM